MKTTYWTLSFMKSPIRYLLTSDFRDLAGPCHKQVPILEKYL
jgi:hypothetical protein